MFYECVGFGVHFVLAYSWASCFAIVSSPAFSVSLLISYFPASFPFFIFLNTTSTSLVIIGGTSSGSVCIVTAWSLSYNSEPWSYNYFLGSLCLDCPAVLSSSFCPATVCSSDLFQALRCLNCVSYFILVVLPDIFPHFLCMVL